MTDDYTLLPESKIPQTPHTESCLSRFIVSPITSAIRSTLRHPAIPTVSFVTTVSTAIFSLTFLTRTKPQDISSEWWNSMTLGAQVFSVTNAAIAIIVNMLVNMKYLPLANEKFKINVSHSCESTSSVLENGVSLFVGLSVGLVYAAQAWESFEWASIFLSVIACVCNFLSYSARRYNSFVDLLDNCKDHFNDDVKFQQMCIRQLKHLDAEFANGVIQPYHGKPLNSDTVSDFLTQLYNQARLKQIALSDKNSSTECLKNTALMMMNFMIGIFCAFPVTIIGIQNAYLGLQIMTQNKCDTLSDRDKILLCLIPGVANGIFYLVSGSTLSASLEDMFRMIKDNKLSIFIALFSITIHAFCATGYYMISDDTEGKDNILGIQKNTSLGKALDIMFFMAVFFTGIVNTDNLFQKKNPLVRDVGDMTYWLERNKFSVETLRNHAIFQAAPTAVNSPTIRHAPPKISNNV